MASEDEIRARLNELVEASGRITRADPTFPNERSRRDHFNEQQARADGWLASAVNVVDTLIGDPQTAHRRFIHNIAANGAHGDFKNQVRRATEVLRAVFADLGRGLFVSVTNTATARVYDDLLDQADEYLAAGGVPVAGVVAGVAFEDVMRRVRAIQAIEPPDIKVDELIAALVKKGVMLETEAKRARAAAGLRTSATHARWEQFGKGDVEACIHFTRDFIAKAFGP